MTRPAAGAKGWAAGCLRARAVPEHLLELDPRLHRLHENQVDRFRDVHPRIEHIHRNGDARQVRLLEVVHQLAAVFGFVRDHPAHVRPLRVHFVEHVLQAQGMFLGHGKDDCPARKLPGTVLDTHVHQLFPLLAQGIPVGNVLLELGAFKIQLIRIDALLDQAVALLFAQLRAADAKNLKFGAGGVQVVIDQVALVDGLPVGVKIGGRAVRAVERCGRCPGR